MPPSDPTVHSGTVTAFFDTLDAANKAVDSLVAAGIPRADVSTTSGEGTGGPENEKGFWESLKELFLPEEDRYTYAEGLRRGGALVSVRANDADYERALEILDAEGAVNLDEREANWRSEGWGGYRSGVASNSGFGHSLESGLEPGAEFRPPRRSVRLRQPRLKPRRRLRGKKRRSLSMRSSCGSVSATSITVVYGFAVTWSKRPLASRSTCGMKAFRLSENRGSPGRRRRRRVSRSHY